MTPYVRVWVCLCVCVRGRCDWGGVAAARGACWHVVTKDTKVFVVTSTVIQIYGKPRTEARDDCF